MRLLPDEFIVKSKLEIDDIKENAIGIARESDELEVDIKDSLSKRN